MRGEMLDEALEILSAAWSGEPVNHRGKHYLVDDVRFLPRPVQRPRVPVWTAAFPGNLKPLRRAARYDGFFPVNLENVDQFARAVAAVRELRGDSTAPYDVAVELPPGQRCRPLRRGRRHLVDDRIGAGSLAGRGARCDSRRPGGMNR